MNLIYSVGSCRIDCRVELQLRDSCCRTGLIEMVGIQDEVIAVVLQQRYGLRRVDKRCETRDISLCRTRFTDQNYFAWLELLYLSDPDVTAARLCLSGSEISDREQSACQ